MDLFQWGRFSLKAQWLWTYELIQDWKRKVLEHFIFWQIFALYRSFCPPHLWYEDKREFWKHSNDPSMAARVLGCGPGPSLPWHLAGICSRAFPQGLCWAKPCFQKSPAEPEEICNSCYGETQEFKWSPELHGAFQTTHFWFSFLKHSWKHSVVSCVAASSRCFLPHQNK